METFNENGMDSKNWDVNREYVRTDDRIPVYYEVMGSNGSERTVWPTEELFEDTEAGQEDNSRLYEMLFEINQKLNMLINHMVDKSGFNMPQARDVNISGGGLRFNCAEKFKVGDRLVVKTFLPIYSNGIKLRCEVVRVDERATGGYDVAVKFIDMDESTRDKIIRYIFAKQRKVLRKGKGPGATGQTH